MTFIYGASPGKLHYGDEQTFQLPATDAGGRKEEFNIEYKRFLLIPSRSLKQRIRGFRLNAEYIWSGISEANVQTLMGIITDQNLRLELSAYSRIYEVVIDSFNLETQDGYAVGNNLEMKLIGRHLIDSIPNPDEFILGFIYGRGIGLISQNRFPDFPDE